MGRRSREDESKERANRILFSKRNDCDANMFDVNRYQQMIYLDSSDNNMSARTRQPFISFRLALLEYKRQLLLIEFH